LRVTSRGLGDVYKRQTLRLLRRLRFANRSALASLLGTEFS
jgi:hypothetical protein